MGNPSTFSAEDQLKGSIAGNKVKSDNANARKLDLARVITDIRSTGKTSLREIANELNARGFGTARGGKWSATQVSRVITQG